MNAMKIGLAILYAVAFLATPLPADAAVTLALAPAAQNAARGTLLVFSGTLTNTSGTEKVFLNDLQVTLAGPSAAVLALEPNTFFANVPGILLPGESYTGVLFRVSLSAAAAPGDYAGTIVLKGGADIIANADLASAPFAIFSPAVSIVATDANASEFGPDSAAFTISRTGGTDLSLPVSFSIAGSAINGTTYTALSTTAVIPAGMGSVPIPVVPLPDNVAQGDRIATLSLTASTAFNPGAAVSASVTIHDKPIDQWRVEKFGPAANEPEAQDLADWEKDGIKNLIEYALDLDPKEVVPDLMFNIGTSGDYRTFSYVPNLTAIDLIYSVEACTDLVSWSTAHIEPVTIANPIPPHRVTVRYDIPAGSLDHIFFRLNVTRLGGGP
jgi:hypothetical protein